MDAIVDFVRGILPKDNFAPGSYYEVQKLVDYLCLQYQVIYVCIENFMITGEGMTTVRDIAFDENLAIRRQAEDFQFNINGCGTFR